MNKHIHTIKIGGYQVRGDYISNTNIASVLFLHGGGLRGRAGFNALRETLAKRDIASVAFDFKGHGETGGELSETSLEDKVKQVVTILDSDILQKPITLIASSMGGYIAIKITELLPIENLILIAPAVYDRNAYRLPFGEEFSSVIRKPYSWINSDAWGIINKYQGNLLILKAENDQVIPKGLVEKIYDSAANVGKRKIVTIKNAMHPLTDWLSKYPNDLELALHEILEFIKK
ncbi:MAG: alpha/beta fold hydrolase [Candidatus Paceibacterota bacterium]